MAKPVSSTTVEGMIGGLPGVGTFGLNTNAASNLAGFIVDSSGNVTAPGTIAATGAITGPRTANVVNSATVGATVQLTAAQSGSVLINVSTSGSPSWTLPANAVSGTEFTFICGNTTAGFTVTSASQVIHFKTSASGTVLTSTTTLTNTQATAIVGDFISIVCDGTAWWMRAISGIFAAS